MAALDWLIRPIAHRGLHDRARGIVENTASAVEAAIEADYAIEVDLRAASDLTPMVFHDRTLDRITEAGGLVTSFTPAELANIRLRHCEDRIITLTELLDLVGGRVPLLLELKSRGSNGGLFEACVAAALTGYQGPVAAMSFYPACVSALAEHAPNLPRGLVSESFADRSWRHLSWRQRFAMRHLVSAAFARPHFVAYSIKALPALAPLAGRAALGWPLLTWTVRTQADRNRAERWADAIIFEGFRP